MGDQFHAPSALTPVPFIKRLIGPQRCSWSFWEEKSSLAPAANWTTIPRLSRQYTVSARSWTKSRYSRDPKKISEMNRARTSSYSEETPIGEIFRKFLLLVSGPLGLSCFAHHRVFYLPLIAGHYRQVKGQQRNNSDHFKSPTKNSIHDKIPPTAVSPTDATLRHMLCVQPSQNSITCHVARVGRGWIMCCAKKNSGAYYVRYTTQGTEKTV